MNEALKGVQYTTQTVHNATYRRFFGEMKLVARCADNRRTRHFLAKVPGDTPVTCKRCGVEAAR